MDEDDPRQQLKREIEHLRLKIKGQQALLKGQVQWEGDQLYEQLKELQMKRVERQKQYKVLMKERYRFSKSAWLQNYVDSFLQQKLNKGVESLGRQIDNILYSRSSKSSISSSGISDNIDSMDWLLSDKAEKHLKEQEKVMEDIKNLQKHLEDIR